jgi:hypothetical protein
MKVEGIKIKRIFFNLAIVASVIISLTSGFKFIG